MKKVLFFTLLLVVMLSNAICFARAPLEPSLPEDVNGRVAAAGTETHVFWDDNDTDGTFNLIEIPAGKQCKSIILQVVPSTTADFDTIIGFHYSTTGDEAGPFIKCDSAFSVPVGKTSGDLGYVRAPAGYKVAVVLLY